MVSFTFEYKKIRKKFEDLKIGDAFMIDSDKCKNHIVYIKTQRIVGTGTALILNNGGFEEFDFNTIVVPVDIIINRITN